MSTDPATVPVGALIAELHSPALTREILATYAQASGDLNPLHLDPAAARTAGFPDVIAHGMLGMAQLGRLLTAHFPATHIESFDARFTGIVPVDDRLHCTARLHARDAHGMTLDLEARTVAGTVAIAGRARVRTS